MYQRTQGNISLFNRINEDILLRKEPVLMIQALSEGATTVQAQGEPSNETTTTTDAAEP